MPASRKTPRRSKSATRKNFSGSLPPDATSLHGLESWHKAMVEKLGWMLLTKARGHGYKIPVYKKSIAHLLDSIESAADQYVDPDRTYDLKVLHMNTLSLKSHVDKYL